MSFLSLFSRSTVHSEFERLVSPHIEHLYRLAFRFTNKSQDAEDLVQDLLVKLYGRQQEMREIERLRPWLDRVLYRMFIDQIRQNQRRPGTDDDGAEPDEIEHPDSGPEQKLEQRLTQERLQAAYTRLSDDHRALLAMHDIEGYTLVELESMLDTPIGTLKSRLHRARKRLRDNL